MKVLLIENSFSEPVSNNEFQNFNIEILKRINNLINRKI